MKWKRGKRSIASKYLLKQKLYRGKIKSLSLPWNFLVQNQEIFENVQIVVRKIKSIVRKFRELILKSQKIKMTGGLSVFEHCDPMGREQEGILQWISWICPTLHFLGHIHAVLNIVWTSCKCNFLGFYETNIVLIILMTISKFSTGILEHLGQALHKNLTQTISSDLLVFWVKQRIQLISYLMNTS